MNTVTCQLPYNVTLESPAGDHITNAYQSGHFYEGGMLEFMRRNFSRGLVYVDAGAFVGGHSLFFRNACAAKHVHAFEANPETYALLEANTGACENVSTYGVALGARTRRGEVAGELEGNLGSTKVKEKSRGPLQIKTLDSFDLDELHIFKIDVEGMGLDVLKGAEKTISRHRPAIFIEMGPDDDISGIIDFMNEHRYEYVQQFNATPTRYYRPMR